LWRPFAILYQVARKSTIHLSTTDQAAVAVMLTPGSAEKKQAALDYMLKQSKAETDSAFFRPCVHSPEPYAL
jgi:hypothetical protein